MSPKEDAGVSVVYVENEPLVPLVPEIIAAF